jgi:anthranilate synthase
MKIMRCSFCFWVVLVFQCLATTKSFGTRSLRPNIGLSKLASTREDAAATRVNDYNSVYVAKEGGRGATTASQQALEKNLSLGAPPARPSGGHYLTRGGVQVTAHVEPLEFSSEKRAGTSASAIEDIIQQLDEHKGVLLTSSYEFPGRYARWSLGFVDPPLEISGRGSSCTIRALNQRGKVILPAVEEAMKSLLQQGVLSKVHVSNQGAKNNGSGDALDGATSRIDVTVVPPPDVGTFNEEERSRQVSC